MVFLKLAINNQNKSKETIPFTNNTDRNTFKKKRTCAQKTSKGNY